MPTVRLSASDTPDLVAARIEEALFTWRRTGGSSPVELLVHPTTRPRLDNEATRRVLSSRSAKLASRETVEPGTIRIRPIGKVYA